MNLDLVVVSVNVAGADVIFSQMTLHQKMNNHHSCEILVDYDAFGDKTWMADPVKIINFIGESLSISMTHKVSGATCVFNGLVSNISFTGYHGANNHILIRGTSETIKLDGKPHIDSFVNKTLGEIVNEVVGTSGNGAAITIKPEYTKPIDYQMQYNETAFDYLNRLSYLYGESFYSKDGSEVFFGKIEPEDPVDITYDVEMTEFNLDANLRPPVFGHYNYLKYYHEEWLKETRKPVPEAAGYLQPALDKSEKIYTSKVNTPSGPLVHDSDSLLKMVDIERTRAVAEMLILSGKTQTCKVGLGKVVTVGFPGNLKIDTSPGAFIVTEITHTVDKEGHYSNEFKGVRAALGYIPVHNAKLPVTAPQRATVLSHADPEGKGRIQVQMQFQKYSGKETSWIRVLSPDAGNSERGYIFIPEVGDEIMVQFEDNDPARPYCAGSLFTEPAARGGLSGNHLKSIITRSGIKMIFNDDEGSLHIEDPSGNTWDMDGKGNIRVNAPNDMSITVGKNMDVSVGENMNINVGNNMSTSVGNNQETSVGKNQQTIVTETIDISANKMNQDIAQNKVTNVGDKTTYTSGDIKMMSTDKDIIIKSVSKALVQGADDARVSKG